MGKNAGCGLFADRVVRKDDNITVYFGKKADTHSKDETRMLEIKGHLIDVKPTCFGAQPLYFRAHFSNLPYYQIPDEKHDYYDRSVHLGRNPNAEIVGVMMGKHPRHSARRRNKVGLRSQEKTSYSDH